MTRKAIIQLVVIIIAFGGSGIVLYNGLIKTKVPIPNPLLAGNLFGQPGASGATVEKILPNGSNLDLTVLSKQNFQFGLVKYPKLDYSKEVGSSEDKIITPAR